MLHSALPRAAYLGAGYFDDAQQQQHHPYVYAQHQVHDSYVAAQRAVFHAWTSAQSPPAAVLRAASPSPLDLSLKPPRSASPIEVDDEEDRRSREEARSQHSAGYYAPPEEDVVVDDQDSRSSSSYHLLQSPAGKSSAGSEIYYHQPQPCSPTGYQPQQLMTPPPTQLHAPMTPPSTPSPPQRPVKTASASPHVTPGKDHPHSKPPRQKKKHARRLKFDEDTSSPVSGTVILGPDEAVVTGDIDPAFNIVEVTEEARAELAKIENRLGPYQCKLCRQLHDDAFQLAQHRCSRIAHVEYRCPECDKRFSCPANLASHRRWHKPRAEANPTAASSPQESLACTRCDAKFARAAALRKHMAQQHPTTTEQNNNEEQQPGKETALAMEMA